MKHCGKDGSTGAQRTPSGPLSVLLQMRSQCMFRGGGSVFSSGGDVQGCVDTKVGSKNNKIPRVLGNRAVLPWHLVNLHLFRAEDQHARRVKSCAQAAKASKKKGKK